MNAPRKFTLDKEAAVKAGGKMKIGATGVYRGVLTRVEYVKSGTGSEGVDMSFKCDDESTADYLSLWTHNKDGEALAGSNLVNALMTILRLQELNAKRARIEKYNRESNKVEMMDAIIYPDLMHKPIGIVLQLEHSTYQGKARTKLLPYQFFDPVTGKTAKEIWGKLPAKDVDLLAINLKDKYEKSNGGTGGSTGGANAPSGHPAFDGLDDDIPY